MLHPTLKGTLFIALRGFRNIIGPPAFILAVTLCQKQFCWVVLQGYPSLFCDLPPLFLCLLTNSHVFIRFKAQAWHHWVPFQGNVTSLIACYLLTAVFCNISPVPVLIEVHTRSNALRHFPQVLFAVKMSCSSRQMDGQTDICSTTHISALLVNKLLQLLTCK